MNPDKQTPHTSSEYFRLPTYDAKGRHVTAAGGVIGETPTPAGEHATTRNSTQRPLGEVGLALDRLANEQGVIGGAPLDTENQRPTFFVEAAPIGQQKPEVASTAPPLDAAETPAQQAHNKGVIGEEPSHQ